MSDALTSLACETSRPNNKALLLSLDPAVHENFCFQPPTCDVTVSHMLFNKIQSLRLPRQGLVAFWHADLYESTRVALSCLVKDLSEQGQWSSNRHRFQKFHIFTDGSHNPENTAGKRLGWALAVLADMCEGNGHFSERRLRPTVMTL